MGFLVLHEKNILYGFLLPLLPVSGRKNQKPFAMIIQNGHNTALAGPAARLSQTSAPWIHSQGAFPAPLSLYGTLFVSQCGPTQMAGRFPHCYFGSRYCFAAGNRLWILQSQEIMTHQNRSWDYVNCLKEISNLAWKYRAFGSVLVNTKQNARQTTHIKSEFLYKRDNS